MDDVAGAETGGVHGPGEAPVVGAGAFGIVDRARRGEDAGQPGQRRGGQPAERAIAGLQLVEFGLAQDGQAREVGTAGDRVRLDARQLLGEIGGIVERMTQ